MILRELLTILGFKADDKVLTAYDKKIIDLKKNLLLVTTAATAVATAIFGITESAARAGDELDKTKDLTGLSVEQLQRLRGAAKLAGVDVDGITISMQLFSRQVSQAAMGQQMSVRAFQMLGISIFGANGKLKDNHTLLLEVADAFSKLHNQQVKTDLALQLFGRSGGRMVNLLKNGAAGVSELEAEFNKFGFTLSEVQSKQAAQFQDRLTMVGFALKGLKNAIGIELLPQVSKLVNEFLGWYAANKKVIQQNLIDLFKDLAKFVKVVADIFGAMLSTLTNLINVFGGWNKVLKITTILLGLLVSTRIIRGLAELGKAVVLLALDFKKLAKIETIADALVLIWPAIAAGIFLVADDIRNFMKGNDSLFGEFVKKFPKIGFVLITIGRVLKEFGKLAKDVFVYGLIDPLKIIWDLLKFIGKAVADVFVVFEKIKHPIKTIGDAIKASHHTNAAVASTGAPANATKMAAHIMTPALAAATAPVSKSVTNNVTTHVNLQVPHGTPDQHANFLKDTAEKTFNKIFEKHLKSALTQFPLME